ncbi:MAG TPA: hypothetical protein VFK41_06345 [Nocardioidaceae bacterium]|nr:hypothetical protein [Nocardioidaceae bacterium]
MGDLTAGEYADKRVAKVRDDPEARLRLLQRLYLVPTEVDRGYLPYRRAASAFMGWQLRRGLLNPETDDAPGSPWWRLVNEALLRDTCEASALAFGVPGEPRTAGAAAALEFIREPSARSWYRAHNLTVATAYLENEELAGQEGQIERFFINLVLVRVLFAHAMVANPRLALGRFAPVSRPLGDPRLGMTATFLSLSRVLPDWYPLTGNLERYVAAEHSIGHLLDVGVILPRGRDLYRWSAEELGLPELNRLLDDRGPCYAWGPEEPDVWDPAPSRLARLARRLAPSGRQGS